MLTETTPIPWRISTKGGKNVIVDADDNVIAHCPRYGAGRVSVGNTAPWHRCDNNAALILKCVNEHKSLCDIMALCERLRLCCNPLLVELADKEPELRKKVIAVQQEARTALDALTELRKPAKNNEQRKTETRS